MEASDETGSTLRAGKRKIRVQFPVRVFGDPPPISKLPSKTKTNYEIYDI
jgi:hypothetical protein